MWGSCPDVRKGEGREGGLGGTQTSNVGSAIELAKLFNRLFEPDLDGPELGHLVFSSYVKEKREGENEEFVRYVAKQKGYGSYLPCSEPPEK